MSIELYDYQLEAVKKMKNGCILCGGVGSGKSRTALAYYYLRNEGEMACLTGCENFIPMNDPPQDLYIITTARKRDTYEWDAEMIPFLLSRDEHEKMYANTVVVDSWNNIGKYSDVKNSFFIFDEQRVVGHGAWVKFFLQITKNNEWILLSATPGDSWMDYVPVFIANGFFKNRSEFNRNHVIFSRYTNYPKVEKYFNTGQLIKYRNSILVNMDYHKPAESHHEDIYVGYDVEKYKEISKLRWNFYENKPIENAAELCFVWRRIVNSAEERQIALLELIEDHPKAIIFYNFDYELELLETLFSNYVFAEWNGHKHESVPEGDAWVYLVQYNAGAEGWNCTSTDTVIFYSQNYSYKITKQAAGRIDRLNTPYTDLYFYHLRSRSAIDIAIGRALKDKKNFNESKFVNVR